MVRDVERHVQGDDSRGSFVFFIKDRCSYPLSQALVRLPRIVLG
jgi:hypothetical protein